MKKEWRLPEQVEIDKKLLDELNFDPVLLSILIRRGYSTRSALESFFNFKLENGNLLEISDKNDNLFYDPFIFRDMEKVVSLIIEHIKARHRIVVYGDYDADGVTSTAVLMEALQIMHAEVEAYLPDRVGEGYGLNKSAIAKIAKSDVKLIITVDTGVRNKEEVAFAKSKGLDVIVTDHHVLPETEAELPDCLLINPADTRNNYPCPFLAGVGVAFKLVSALLIRSKLDKSQKKLIADKALDLVAVGTIADMVSLLDENRLLVKKGLEVINKNQRLGLKKLFIQAGIRENQEIEAWNIGWQIGPRLNAASRLSHANTAFALLSANNEEEAEELAAELDERNNRRQQITSEIMSQVDDQIDKDNLPEMIIGVAKEDQVWNEGVIGLVAGKIAEKYYRPSLVITRLVEEQEFDEKTKKMIVKKVSFKGSGRSIPELNLISLVEECSGDLAKYGGHPMACGFSIDNPDKLDSFKQKILTLSHEKLKGLNLVKKINIDTVVEAGQMTLDLAKGIQGLAPFGQNNQEPLLATFSLRISDIMFMGKDSQHVKIKVAALWALCFNGTKKYGHLKVGDVIDLIYYLQVNKFNGREEAQLKIIDLKISENK